MFTFKFESCQPGEATHFQCQGHIVPMSEYHEWSAARGLSSPCVLNLKRVEDETPRWAEALHGAAAFCHHGLPVGRENHICEPPVEDTHADEIADAANNHGQDE